MIKWLLDLLSPGDRVRHIAINGSDPSVRPDCSAGYPTDAQTLTAAAEVGKEVPTPQMMIDHLNEQIQTLVDENKRLTTAAGVKVKQGTRKLYTEAESAEAAAEVGDQVIWEMWREGDIKDKQDVINATIERCAQVADDFRNLATKFFATAKDQYYHGQATAAEDITAAIRALKGKEP